MHMKVAWMCLVFGACHASTPCDTLYSGTLGMMPFNVDQLLFDTLFTSLCGAYQEALVTHPQVNFTVTDVHSMVGGDDPVDLSSGIYKLWLHAQMLHYSETDIEFMWLDAPWIRSISDYLEPIPLTDAQRAMFLPKTVQTNADGEMVTIPIKANYRMNVYRHDLFVKYNETWPTSWVEFERICEKITLGEWAEGTPFWCLSWNLDTRDTNMFSSYFSMMASTDGGGDVVLPGGIPNVNTLQVRKALTTMKRWINSDIMFASVEAKVRYAAAGHNPDFWQGNSLVWQTWSDRMADPETEPSKHGSPAHCVFKIGGGLGTERAMDGSWHLGVNRAIRHKETGLSFLNELIPHLYNITLHYKKLAPLVHGIWDNPQRRDQWCQHVPSYCEAYDKYREYHTSLSYRPSKGCGALYNECVQLIAQHFMTGFVHGTTPLEQAIVDLEAGLGKLLGKLEVQVTTAASEEAESSRAAMIAVACVVGVLLVLVAVYVWFSLKKLRTVGIKVPVAAMLGFVTAVSLTVVTVIVLTTSDSSARAISEDLALRARVTALSLVQVAVSDSRVADPDLSAPHRTRITLSLLMHWVSQLKLDKGALILILRYDERTRLVQVMMSTDNSVQKEHVFLSINAAANGLRVSPLLKAFLEVFAPTLLMHAEADPEQQITVHADRGYFVNVKTVSVVGKWHCVYFVPVSTVMGEATDSLNAARNYGIIASLIAVLVVTVFATLITRPLIDVSHHMEKARMMEFDPSYAPGSFLSETHALQEGFRSMAELLVQYKTFLPQNIFYSDEEKEVAELAKSESSSSKSDSTQHTTSTSASIASIASIVTLRHNMQSTIAPIADLTTLKEMKCSIVLISIENMAELATGVTFTEFFEFVEEKVAFMHGALHIFNTASPGHLTASFGLTRTRAPTICCEQAVVFAFDLLKSALVVNQKVLLAVTVHQGRMRVGNLGSMNMRGFGVVGKGAAEALCAGQYAGDLVRATQTSVVLCTSVAHDMMTTRTKSRPVSILRLPDKTKFIVTQLQELMALSEEEWMYELEESMRRKGKDCALCTWIQTLYTGPPDVHALYKEIMSTSFDPSDTVGNAVATQLKTLTRDGHDTEYSAQRIYTWG